MVVTSEALFKSCDVALVVHTRRFKLLNFNDI